MMLVREIRKALDGEDYKYIPAGERKQIDVPACPEFIAAHYLQIFTRWKKFGLFHGRGQVGELPWYIDYLQYMDGVHGAIEAWHIRRSTAADSASPADFGVTG
jgi:hypothetical protein